MGTLQDAGRLQAQTSLCAVETRYMGRSMSCGVKHALYIEPQAGYPLLGRYRVALSLGV